jgi:hypothetical protein
MSKTTVRAEKLECDKPGCLVKHYVENGDDPPEGFTGTVVQVADGCGSGLVDWYACTEEHISGAILAALEEARDA